MVAACRYLCYPGKLKGAAMYYLDDTTLGVWIDLPKKMVLTPEFFEWFADELQFDLMSIMIDNADPVVAFSWSEKDVETALRLADPYAIEIGLTTWPYPVAGLLRRMEQKMDALLAVGPVSEWETDQEFNWQEGSVNGFADLDAAGDELVAIKKRLCEKYGCRNTITTFTYHRENSSRSDTAPHADRAMIQAYAIDERDGKPITYNHRFGPGRMQTLTLDRALQIPGVKEKKVELGVGHAAWAQEGFTEKRVINEALGKSVLLSVPEAAMRISFEAALPYEPVAHNWWSAKYIYPKSPKYLHYAFSFLRSLRAP